MKKPIASGRISERIGKTIVTRPHHDVREQQRPDRVGAQAAPRDEDPADDEPEARERDQDAPRLDRHQRQPVRVHERHEHAAQEVVERREQQQREQPRDQPDRADRARDVDDARACPRSAWAAPRGCGSSGGGRRRARSARPRWPRHQPMPSRPMARPLNTEVIANATPLAVPTRPFARSRPVLGDQQRHGRRERDRAQVAGDRARRGRAR